MKLITYLNKFLYDTHMSFKISLQIIRKDTEYESYRIAIPKAIIKAHNLRDKDFKLEIKNGKLILIPVER
jgi:hypothetical protein